MTTENTKDPRVAKATELHSTIMDLVLQIGPKSGLSPSEVGSTLVATGLDMMRNGVADNALIAVAELATRKANEIRELRKSGMSETAIRFHFLRKQCPPENLEKLNAMEAAHEVLAEQGLV